MVNLCEQVKWHHLVCLPFIILPVHNSYTVNERAKPFNMSWMTTFRHSDTHSLEIGIAHWPGIGAGSSCWTSPLLHRGVICCKCFVIHACKFIDWLRYDWDKIVVTRLNHSLTSATTPSASNPSSTGHTATLAALLITRTHSCYSDTIHNRHYLSVGRSGHIRSCDHHN